MRRKDAETVSLRLERAGVGRCSFTTDETRMWVRNTYFRGLILGTIFRRMRKIRRIKITLRRTDFAVKKLFSLIPYQLILYQRIVLISPGIHVGWGDEMEVVEHDVFGCVPRVRGLIVFKSTLVYWGEEKDSGRSLGKSPLGQGWAVLQRGGYG